MIVGWSGARTALNDFLAQVFSPNLVDWYEPDSFFEISNAVPVAPVSVVKVLESIRPSGN